MTTSSSKAWMPYLVFLLALPWWASGARAWHQAGQAEPPVAVVEPRTDNPVALEAVEEPVVVPGAGDFPSPVGGAWANAGAGFASGNPGATNLFTGTGALGRFLGLAEDSPVRLGGIWIGDANWLMAGGLQPGDWTGDSLTLLEANLDGDRAFNWKGSLFSIEFLQYAGQQANLDAGSVQGYNNLPGPPPLVRQELYKLWWRQELLDGRLVFRVGKQVPTVDFANVVNPTPTNLASAAIPAVTGLIFTPAFVNPAMLGPTPGYYNSATGFSTAINLTERFYVRYGVFDGSLAVGEQTGLMGPQFNGYYFNIWEAGRSWALGPFEKPGRFGLGFWHQTGELPTPAGGRDNGATGFYLFGTQRLWFRNPGVDISGISGFYQFGCNSSNAMMVRQFFGAGLTGFSLIPSRPKDSMGCGFGWGLLNEDPQAGSFFFGCVGPNPTPLRDNELMLQGYYQAHLFGDTFLEPALSFLPNPGIRPDIPAAWAMTLRILCQF